MKPIRPALLLAVVATGTAISMSVLAGWQRGGWLSEKLVWVAVSVVLVGGAHLLPALCRHAPRTVRGVGAVLWLGCMVAASYGHATFFTLAQLHAGDARASAVSLISVPVHRTLTVVMAERASITADLAAANARRCTDNCRTLEGRRSLLAARLDALDAEAADVHQYQAIEGYHAQQRYSARADPVAILAGITNAKLDLFTGLAFATVLEGLACIGWWLALLPRSESPPVTKRHAPKPDVTTSVPAVTATADSPVSAVTEPELEVVKLRRDIEAGVIQPTVASIRRHLGCAQAKAAALRKQVLSSTS